MIRFKRIALRLLYPGAVWIAMFTIVSAAALIYVFLNELDTSLLAFAAYILSAYTMTVLVVLLPRAYRKVKSLLYNNRYSNRYITDAPFRTRLSMYMSLIINLVYAVFQLVIGIFYTSFWYGAVAVYYIILSVVRFILLRYFRRGAGEPEQELKAYRFCGLLLFALNAAVAGMVVQMVRDGQGARYPGLMVYVMATYAFYRIVISIINVVKQRKLNSPVLAASTALNLATALMAIFTLETAMLAEFGESGSFERVMTTATGSCVCLFILCMAIFMVWQANKRLTALRVNNTQT